MNFKKITTLIGIAALSLGLSGCKNSLSSGSNDKLGGCESNASLCVDPPVNTVPEMTGKISDGAYSGMEVIRIDQIAKELIISMPMPLPFGKPMKKDINDGKLQNAYWELKQYAMNKWAVEIHLPLESLVKGKFSDIPAATLPNGQALPGVPAGELPGFAVKWDDGDSKELFIYLGGGTAAVFVPTYKFDPYFQIDIPIKTEKKDLVGWFSTIPETEVYFGGFYLATLLPRDVAGWIDDNLQ